MSQAVIKIFGCHRTCTNLTTVLIRNNFRARVLTNHPWHKHGEWGQQNRTVHDHDGSLLTEEVKFVICAKNPYSYIRSTFEFFKLRGDKYRFRGNLNEWIAGWPKMDALERYNRLYPHWLGLSDDPSVIQLVKAEEAQKRQDRILDRLQYEMGLESKREDLAPVDMTVNPCEKTTAAPFRARENNLTVQQIAHINERVDSETMALLGYSIEA